MTRRMALITGAAGQDAGYLSERLSSAGYEVVGSVHRTEPQKRDPSTIL